MKLLPDLEADGNIVRSAWDRMSKVPGGKFLFSRALGRLIPYTGTIKAVVSELRPGHATVEMADGPAVRNHLRCVHAIALANLAELTANIGLAYSMPDDARFIVAGMDMTYVKKARGKITASAGCPVLETSAQADFDL